MQGTTQQCEKIDKQSLEQLLVTNNWELEEYSGFHGFDECNIFTCINLNNDYLITPMSDLPDNDPEKAKYGRLYLSEYGKYCVRTLPDGSVNEGEIDEIKPDLIDSNETYQEVKTRVLKVTSSRDHTITHAIMPCIYQIRIIGKLDIIKNKINYELNIFFTTEGTRKIFAGFNATPDNFHTLFDKHFKEDMYIPEFQIENADDINNFKLTLSVQLDMYKNNAIDIYNFIKMSGDDISEDMWSKLVQILPFREKSGIEKLLETILATHLKTISTLQHDADFTDYLQQIVDISKQLSEIQQSPYVFDTTAEKLFKLGFGEITKEFLDKTLMFNKDTRTALVYNEEGILKICSISKKESSKKYAQEALNYFPQTKINNLNDIINKIKLLGFAAGNENLFQEFIPTEESIDASTNIETLASETFIKINVQMCEIIYLHDEENKSHNEENQDLREKVSRLEAELARNNANNTELPSYTNHSAAASTTSITEATMKDESKSFKP